MPVDGIYYMVENQKKGGPHNVIRPIIFRNYQKLL